MKILVACEYSGVVRDAFIRKGHDAVSCDLLPSESDFGPHIIGDVLDVLKRERFDMMVAHPPCTFLCNSGAKHLYIGTKKENGICPDRWAKMEEAAAFYRRLLEQDIERIVVENPIMHLHAAALIGSRATQFIQPWQHGHKEMKATGLHLRGLPKLVPSNVVGPPPKDPVERRKWAVVHRASPGPDRWKDRSRTYPGIADAFGEQWG